MEANIKFTGLTEREEEILYDFENAYPDDVLTYKTKKSLSGDQIFTIAVNFGPVLLDVFANILFKIYDERKKKAEESSKDKAESQNITYNLYININNQGNLPLNEKSISEMTEDISKNMGEQKGE